MSLGEKIKELRQRKNITQQELAKRIGLSQSHLSLLEAGKRSLNFDQIEKIAKTFGMSIYEFFDEGINDRRYGPIPVISWVQAGKFDEAVESWEGETVFSIKKVSPRAFALRVEGDSMEPRFMEGDIIIVDPALGCENGDYCVVWLNGEVTFKKLGKNEKEIRLIALNEKYPEMVIHKDKPVDFHIIGRVVDMLPKL